MAVTRVIEDMLKMAKSIEDLPEPMLETKLLEICKSDIVDGIPRYPEIEDRAEIEDGDYVILTAELEFECKSQGDNPTETYAIPAKATRTDEGLEIHPCDIDMWNLAWKKPDPVTVNANTLLRATRANAITDDSNKISDYHDDIDNTIIRCQTRISETSPGYRRAVSSGKGADKTTNTARVSLFSEAMRQLMQLTPYSWHRLRPKDLDNITKEDIARFDPYLKKATNIISSDQVNPVNSMGNTDTNIKYITMMMDIAASDGVPDPDQPDEAKDVDSLPQNNTGNEINQLRKEMAEMGKRHSAELVKIYGLLNTMSHQLRLQERMEHGEEKMQVRLMECPADHSCLFYALKIIADKFQNADCPIVATESRAKRARSIMLWHARQMWVEEKDAWKQEFGDETFDEFYARHSDKPSTNNWGGMPEINLFNREYPTLEFRLILNEVGTDPVPLSIKGDGQHATKVAFLVWNGAHYNIGTGKMGSSTSETVATNKVIFDAEDADRVQVLLVEHLAGQKPTDESKKNRRVRFAQDKDPQQTKEDFFRQAEKDMNMGGDGDWTTFEREDKRQRQERKRKEKEKKEKEEKEKREKEQQSNREKENAARHALLIQQQTSALRTAQEQTARLQQALQAQQNQAGMIQGQHAHPTAWVIPPQQHHHHQVQQQAPQHHQHQQTTYLQALQGQGCHQPSTQVTGSVSTGREFDLILGGAPVVPAAVIFTKETVGRVKAMLRKTVPASAELVKAVVKRGAGGNGERCELHCLLNDVPIVQTAIPTLRNNGIRVDVYKQQQRRTTEPGGLSAQSATGMEEAIRRAGVCRQYYHGQPCNRSPCKFKCYGSQLPQYPAPLC